MRARKWLVAAGVSLALSAAAVALVVLPAAGSWPGAIWRAAETFASPGELLWLATLGSVFAGRPGDAAGIAVWVLGTAAFWFVVAAPFVAFAGRRRQKEMEAS